MANKEKGFYTEEGHSFLSAIQNGNRILQQHQDRVEMPRTIAEAMFLRSNPKGIVDRCAVFFSGNVYKTIEERGRRLKFSEPDPWREKACAAAIKAGAIPLHGVNDILHGISAPGGAGYSFLAIDNAAMIIVNGLSRMGLATGKEVEHARKRGLNPGLICNDKDYDEFNRYIVGKTTRIPERYPMYLGLDLQAGDLIKGFVDIPRWIRAQRRLLHPRFFDNRQTDDAILRLENHFAFNHSSDPRVDISQFDAVVNA